MSTVVPAPTERTVTGVEVVLPVVPAPDNDPPAQATTTSEEQRHTQSQRDVNLIWEKTQRQLSLIVVAAAMINGTWVTVANAFHISGAEIQTPTIFSLGFGMVCGFYFGRTNHQRVGGVQLGR